MSNAQQTLKASNNFFIQFAKAAVPASSLGHRISWKNWNSCAVSKNDGTPKSSILIGFSIINHPFWGTPIFGNIQLFQAGKLAEAHQSKAQCRDLPPNQRKMDDHRLKPLRATIETKLMKVEQSARSISSLDSPWRPKERNKVRNNVNIVCYK